MDKQAITQHESEPDRMLPPSSPHPALNRVVLRPTLPGMDPPPPNPTEISDAAQAVFEGKHEGDPDWLLYYDLVKPPHNWPWRKAAYIAWIVQPKDRREISTEGAFAVKELALTSARTIRDWKADPNFIGFIRDISKSVLLSARLDIFGALVASASNDNPRNHADRKLALEMMGDYVPRQTVRVGSELPDSMAEMSTDELIALINTDAPELANA